MIVKLKFTKSKIMAIQDRICFSDIQDKAVEVEIDITNQQVISNNEDLRSVSINREKKTIMLEVNDGYPRGKNWAEWLAKHGEASLIQSSDTWEFSLNNDVNIATNQHHLIFWTISFGNQLRVDQNVVVVGRLTMNSGDFEEVSFNAKVLTINLI